MEQEQGCGEQRQGCGMRWNTAREEAFAHGEEVDRVAGGRSGGNETALMFGRNLP